MMGYLAGKRFKYRCGNAKGTTTGTIVSEPFRSEIITDKIQVTCVAILWDDGSIKGSVNIENLQIIDDSGYVVVCRALPNSGPEDEIILETHMGETSLEDARQRLSNPGFKQRKPRIAKLHFIED